MDMECGEVDGDIWIWSVVRWMVIYGYGSTDVLLRVFTVCLAPVFLSPQIVCTAL
jgi:hypothetical protein